MRPGYITREMIERVAGRTELDRAITEGAPVTAVPKAPGMKYKHYAPKGELTVVECTRKDGTQKVIDKINQLTEEMSMKGFKVGVLATDATKEYYNADVVVSVGDRSQEISISSHLFGCLREFDDRGVDYIYSESFSRENVGMAIMNRLMKAAGGRIIRI